MRSRTRLDPDCTGRWSQGQRVGSSAKATARASVKSLGWLVVNRRRSRPDTPLTLRNSSTKSPALPLAPAYELTFCPMRVTSLTPSASCPLISSTISVMERLTSGPRTWGTTQ